MFQNWLNSLDSEYLPAKDFENYQIGSRITRWNDEISGVPANQVVLIGIDKKLASRTRKALYQLSAGEGKLPLTDLGNLRNDNADSLIPVLRECIAGKLMVILIGQDERMAYAQYQSFAELGRSINLAYIGEQIPLKLNEGNALPLLSKIVRASDKFLFNLSCIGFQSHFIDPDILDFLEKRHADMLRLGRVQKQVQLVEPLCRDSNSLVFNMNTLTFIEAPAQKEVSPNGINASQACQIAYYAGISDKLQSIGFYGLHSEKEKNGQSTNLLAQMIWYFVEGFRKRHEDFPDQMEKFTRYVVDLKGHDSPLTFLKSNLSERWWIQVPNVEEAHKKAHRFVPCLYDDYRLACEGEVSDRFFKALARFID